MKRRLTILKTKQNAILLTVFAIVCTLAVSLTHLVTAPIIEEQKQQALLFSLTELLDTELYDNNPLLNCTVVTQQELTGSDQPIKVYRATNQEQPYALIFKTQTEQGYNGLIELLIAVDAAGVVQGVRTLSHQETPGLGDKIELVKSDWILSFNNKQVRHIEDPTWNVKKDGGNFDQFTGATITPRAIVKQIKQSTFIATQQFDALFNSSNSCNTTKQATNNIGEAGE